MQKAARVWPLGKLLLVGVRTVASRWSSGRCRSTAAFTIRLTMSEENPAAASATTARRRSGAAAPCLDAGEEHPDEPVVGQVGDDGGGAVDLRATPERLEGGVDRLVDRADSRTTVVHAAKAGQEVLKWQWSHSGPTWGRKSSASHARSMAVHTATARLRWPRMVCSEATDEMATGWRR